MNIGVDVDGVLTDIAAFQIKHGEKYFKRTPANKSCYYIKDMFECTNEESKKFWIKYVWKYCLLEKPRKNAPEFMQYLKKQGHQIYIITSRAYCTKRNVMGIIFRFMLKFWLKKNGFPYDAIYYSNEDNSASEKLQYCQKLNITVMFEDGIENIMAIKQQASVVCISTDYNQNLQDEDITKVSGFDELIHLKNLKLS